MTKRFDLYGWRSLPPAEAARRLDPLPGLKLKLRHSFYHGGDYYLGSSDAIQKLIVQSNFEDEDGYLAEPDFPDHKTLVYVTYAREDSADLFRELSDLTLLRTKRL